MRRLIPLLFMLYVSTFLLTACSGENGQNTAEIKLSATQDMPAEVQGAPLTVLQAYQFAAANPDVTQHIPCYCGCGAMGHTSNYSCYVSGEHPDGSLKYDEHALGCSICVDITQDAMRLQKEGKTIPEIKQYIDDTYAPYGPSNMP